MKWIIFVVYINLNLNKQIEIEVIYLKRKKNQLKLNYIDVYTQNKAAYYLRKEIL